MSRYRIRGGSASAIAASIEGALAAGTFEAKDGRLPTIRKLAVELKVSPVTVAAAYRLLRARGLVVARGRAGTRLRGSATAPPALPTTRRRAGAGLVDLSTGNPDPELLPSFSHVLATLEPEHHLYEGPMELPALAAFAAGEFQADGIPRGPVAVTNGGLDGIERVLREHVRPGDRVAVEDPVLPALLDLLGSLGLTPEPFSLDEEGPSPESFARALAARVRALVVTSRAQNPTGAAVSPRRAGDLSGVLRRHPHVLLIEVDEAAGVSGVPFVTLCADRAAWAVVRSTSKFLGPDLRLAVVTGDPLTITRLQRRQATSVRWVSHLLQKLALALWSDPSSGRRLARAADLYTERRSTLVAALAGHGITASGRSGLNVWIPVREETPLVQALAAAGWAVAPGERFRVRSAPAIRVTTSALTPEEATRFAADLASSARPSATARA